MEKADISTLVKTGHLYFGPTDLKNGKNCPMLGEDLPDIATGYTARAVEMVRESY
jgi:hypothetical protein